MVTKNYTIPDSEISMIKHFVKVHECDIEAKKQLARASKDVLYKGIISNWYFHNISKLAQAIELLKDAICYLEGKTIVRQFHYDGASYEKAKDALNAV